ncbi:hypothetical protein AOLI_G00066800 [Acnodon oligacanthus]
MKIVKCAFLSWENKPNPMLSPPPQLEPSSPHIADHVGFKTAAFPRKPLQIAVQSSRHIPLCCGPILSVRSGKTTYGSINRLGLDPWHSGNSGRPGGEAG